MKNITLSFLAVFALMLGSCNSNKIPENFDYGKTENGVYTNSFFNLSLPYPAEWKLQSREQLDAMVQSSKDMLQKQDKSIDAAIKASEVNTAYLFSAFKYEVGAPAEEFNASIMLVAENTKAYPGIKEGKDYLLHTKKLLEKTDFHYTFDKDIYSKKIGSKNFDVMETTMNYAGVEIHQAYYTTVLNGFSLSVIMSYGNEAQKKELEDTLSKMSI